MQLPETVEMKGIRTLTSKQIAELYGTTTDIVKKNFSNNRERFIDGKHYISLTGDELKTFKEQVKKVHLVANRTSHLYLWTEKGALLHAKSLNTDKAWEAYDYLVDFYFRAKEQISEPKPVETKKKTGREVVDVPENIKMQKAILEVQKYLTALDVTLDEFNGYRCEANYMHVKRALEILWTGLGWKLTELMDIEPKLVVKEGY